jgi:hypothetical protein
MRVQMKYGSAPTTPCGTVGDGEIEDYAINLSSVPQSTSLNEEAETIIAKAGLSVYPNPTTDILHYNVYNVETDGPAVVQMISADGRVVYAQEISMLKNSSNENSIQLGSLPSGVYTLRIVNNEVNMKTTFVKQ